MNKALSTRPLTPSDAEVISAMLTKQSECYIQYFRPFDFGLASIRELLMKAQNDIFMGIFWGENLAGFFFLRGWDEGYDIPAYGVVIDQEFRCIGLGSLTLNAAKTLCKLRHVPRVMLKVHPNNLAARHLYEAAGFIQSGSDPKNDNLIYHFDLA